MVVPTSASRRPRPGARPSLRRRRGPQGPWCSRARRAPARGRRREGRLMAQPMAESRAEHDEESRPERVNRELIELLNELRVALPGVQVLFAFLLTVPFSNGYNRITGFQKDLYFAILVATAISTACFIVPTAYHRLNFRRQEKEQILLRSNKFAIAGLMSLALSMIGVIVLITDVIYSDAAAAWTGVLAAGLFFGLWLVLPLLVRLSDED